MGMAEMFSNRANLSGLLEFRTQLKVSEVVHKAFIEVTERGTEAGAAAGKFSLNRTIYIQFFQEDI